jgi:hypothetical protein
MPDVHTIRLLDVHTMCRTGDGKEKKRSFLSIFLK